MGESRKKTSWTRRLSYLLLRTGGGAGIGGWQLSDETSTLARVAQVVLGEDGPGDGDGVGATRVLQKGLSVAAEQMDPFRRPGLFEVKVDRVALGDEEFETGKTLDIQARVVRINPDGQQSVVWDTRKFGQRLAVVGRDDLTAGWDERPFQIAWKPGDRYLFEVWNCKGWSYTRLFVVDRAGRSDEFPLRAGTIQLGLMADGKPVKDPSRNTVVLASRRIGDSAADGEPAPGRATEVAARPRATR